MRTIGNIIWIVFLGGLFTALGYALAGIIFYITIIGIPLGRQAFKMAQLSLTPFGKTIIYGGGAPSLLANIVWVVVIGLWTAIGFVLAGAVFCITIVGIPFGMQLFKMAKLALMPFGAQVLDAA
ncbi:MAG: YccF domain-containing protein [Atopobiaceae bacterium]|nr:YccF domain-containing protein [Atopobiaceae bacterium]